MIDLTRRSLLAGACGFAGVVALGGIGRAFGTDGGAFLRPPGGQSEADFASRCLKCDKCRSICPTDCIDTCTLDDGLLNYRLPRIDFHKGYCTFCYDCLDVCPTDALQSFDETVDKIGVAVVDPSECIAYAKGGCRICADACSYGAVTLSDTSKPVVDVSVCNGCGQCEYECPSASYGTFDGSKNRGINVVRLTEARDLSSGVE